MTATVHTGLMRHKATFQVNTPTAMPGGGEKDVYTDLVTTRGYLQKLNGGRSLEASSLLVNNRYRFTCRYFSDIVDNVTKTARLVIDGRYFIIDSFEQAEQKQFLYVFYLKEKE